MTDETRQPWTPGTWVLKEWQLDDEMGMAKGYSIETSDGVFLADIGGEDEEMCANGKLMAAAPAMAEALAAVVHRYDTRTTDDMCRRPGERKDPPDVAACRAALNLCGWQWGGR